MSDNARTQVPDRGDAQTDGTRPIGVKINHVRQGAALDTIPLRRHVVPLLELNLLTRLDTRHAPLFEEAHVRGQVIAQILRSRAAFRVPSAAPTIALIEDDVDGALGPLDYDAESIRTCVRRCTAAVVTIGDHSPTLYRTASEMVAGKWSRVLLIETGPDRLHAWEGTLRAARPRLRIIVRALPPAKIST